MKKLIIAIMLLSGGIIFSSNANKPIENIASFETYISHKMSFSVQPNASKPTTVDKYIFTAVESANYGTATG